MASKSNYENWSKEKFVQGKSILFRMEGPSDFDKVWEMYATLGAESIESLPPYNKELVQRWVQNIGNNLIAVLGLYEGKVIGRGILTLGEYASVKHRAEFGVVVHDDFQNIGVGSLLTEIMIELARDLDLRKVTLEVFSSNLRGIHVYEKYGYVKEGVLRDHYFFRNRYYDVVLMGLYLDDRYLGKH